MAAGRVGADKKSPTKKSPAKAGKKSLSPQRAVAKNSARPAKKTSASRESALGKAKLPGKTKPAASARATRKSGRAEEDPYYLDAALYEANFAHKSEDIDFYLALAAETGGPILEYGAGAGRVTIPLLEAGYDVTAVDLSPTMLALLERRLRESRAPSLGKLRVVRGDMTKKKGLGKHALALATFNVVGHLHRFEELGELLRRVREHLPSGAIFAFDVPVPAPEELGAEPDDVFRAPRRKHPTTGQWIREEERFAYDPMSQVLTVESDLYVEGFPDPLTVPLRLRQWFPRELEALLVYEGFREIRLLADYTFIPALEDVDMLVVVAKTP